MEPSRRDDTAYWRLGLLCLVIGALSACATHRDSFAGIRYQTPTAQFGLTPACVEWIRDTGHAPALQIGVAPGPCEARFKRFFRTHRGQTVTARFQGQRLSGPTTIVGPMRAPFIQPVRTNRQVEAIRTYYRKR